MPEESTQKECLLSFVNLFGIADANLHLGNLKRKAGRKAKQGKGGDLVTEFGTTIQQVGPFCSKLGIVELFRNGRVSFTKGQDRTFHHRPKHPGKVHVWCAISRRGASNMIIFTGNMDANFYVTEILKNTLLPFVHQVFPDHHRFQQDNDPKHTSRLAKEFMATNGIHC